MFVGFDSQNTVKKITEKLHVFRKVPRFPGLSKDQFRAISETCIKIAKALREFDGEE